MGSIKGVEMTHRGCKISPGFTEHWYLQPVMLQSQHNLELSTPQTQLMVISLNNSRITYTYHFSCLISFYGIFVIFSICTLFSADFEQYFLLFFCTLITISLLKACFYTVFKV